MNQTTHKEADMDITKLSDDNTPERDDFNTTTKLKNFFREYAEDDDNSTDTVSPQGYILTQSPSVSNKTLRNVDIMDDEASTTFKMDFHLADSPVKDISPTKSKVSGAHFLKILSEGTSNVSSKEHFEKQSQIQLILNNIDNTRNDESLHERVAAKDLMSRLTTQSNKNIDEVNQSFNLNDMTKLSAVSIDLDSSVDLTEKILKELNASIATSVLPKQIPSTVSAQKNNTQTEDTENAEENEGNSKMHSTMSLTKVKPLNLQDLFPKRAISTLSPKSSPVKNSQHFRSRKQLDISDQETPNQSVCKTPEVIQDDDVLPDADPNSTAQTPSFIETFKEINLTKPKNAETCNPTAESFIDNFNELKTDSTPDTNQTVATEKEPRTSEVEKAKILDLSKTNLSVKISQDSKEAKCISAAQQSLRSYADYCETFGMTPNVSAAKKVNLGAESPTKDNQKSSIQVTPTKKDSQQTNPQDFDHAHASALPQIITVTPRRALPAQQQDVQTMKPTEPKPSILSFQESSESAFASVPLNRNKTISDTVDVNSKTNAGMSPNVTSSKQDTVQEKSPVRLAIHKEQSPKTENIVIKSPVKEAAHFEEQSSVVPLPKNASMSKSITYKFDIKVSNTEPNNKSLLMNTLPGKSPEAVVLDSPAEQVVLDSPQQSKMQTEMDLIEERDEEVITSKGISAFKAVEGNRRRTFTLPKKILQKQEQEEEEGKKTATVEENKDRRRTFVIDKQQVSVASPEEKAINQAVVLDAPTTLTKNKEGKKSINDRRLTYVIPPSVQQQQLSNETVDLEPKQPAATSRTNVSPSPSDVERFNETHTIIREKMPSLTNSDIKDPEKLDRRMTILASNDKWLDESNTFEHTLVFKPPIASSSMMVSNDYGILTEDDNTEVISPVEKSTDWISKTKELYDYKSVVAKAIAEAEKSLMQRLNARKDADSRTGKNAIEDGAVTATIVSQAIAEAEKSILRRLNAQKNAGHIAAMADDKEEQLTAGVVCQAIAEAERSLIKQLEDSNSDMSHNESAIIGKMYSKFLLIFFNKDEYFCKKILKVSSW